MENTTFYFDSAYSIGCFGDAGRKCRHRGWKNSKGKAAANIDLLQMALAWRQAYGTRFEFTHVYAHTGKQDRLSIGNHHADRLAPRVLGGRSADPTAEPDFHNKYISLRYIFELGAL